MPTAAATVVPSRSSAGADLSKVTAIRRELHAHPELSFDEKKTSALVQRELAALGVQFKAGLANGTGVLGFIPATGDPKRSPTVALRADMDALPINENTGAAHASKTPGVMHACGHDGHTAVLLGAAAAISRAAHRPNNTILVFQPAEEGGAGGDLMCKDGALNGSHFGIGPVDHIYGLHGWPDLPVGSVATRAGPLLASTDDYHVTIHGKGGHAAYPHICIDPVVVAAHVITALQTIASRRVSPADSVVITVASLHAGNSANNIISDTAHFIGTLRTLKNGTRTLAEQEFKRIVTHTAEAFGARAEIMWHRGYPVTENNPAATDRFRAIARRVLPADRVLEREHATMGGEDFSYYGEYAKACFYFLGLKPTGAQSMPGLHTPEFDFNDDALPVGIEMMSALALEPLER